VARLRTSFHNYNVSNFGLPAGAERGRNLCLCIISCCTGGISSSLNGKVLCESSLNDLNYSPSPSNFRICFGKLHTCIARRDCFSLDIILHRSLLVEFFYTTSPPYTSLWIANLSIPASPNCFQARSVFTTTKNGSQWQTIV
jgi:hypothetical protein